MGPSPRSRTTNLRTLTDFAKELTCRIAYSMFQLTIEVYIYVYGYVRMDMWLNMLKLCNCPLFCTFLEYKFLAQTSCDSRFRPFAISEYEDT